MSKQGAHHNFFFHNQAICKNHSHKRLESRRNTLSPPSDIQYATTGIMRFLFKDTYATNGTSWRFAIIISWKTRISFFCCNCSFEKNLIYQKWGFNNKSHDPTQKKCARPSSEDRGKKLPYYCQDQPWDPRIAKTKLASIVDTLHVPNLASSAGKKHCPSNLKNDIHSWGQQQQK